jgi:hypothetical protein
MEGGAKFLFRDFDEDVVVAAGDIGRPAAVARDLRAMFPYKEIIQVAGNHEYYTHDFDKANGIMRAEAEKYEIHFLENDMVTIGDQRFLGATFWTDPPVLAKFGIADFTYIFKNKKCFTVDDAAKLHYETVNFLDDNLLETDIVVTHFLPTWQFIHPRFSGNELNGYFANEYPYYLAKLWLHGHTHDQIDEEKIKCFPYGYRGENNHYDYQGLFIDV